MRPGGVRRPKGTKVRPRRRRSFVRKVRKKLLRRALSRTSPAVCTSSGNRGHAEAVDVHLPIFSQETTEGMQRQWMYIFPTGNRGHAEAVDVHLPIFPTGNRGHAETMESAMVEDGESRCSKGGAVKDGGWGTCIAGDEGWGRKGTGCFLSRVRNSVSPIVSHALLGRYYTAPQTIYSTQQHYSLCA